MKSHGAWLYGVHRTRRDGSSFMWHQSYQCCKCIHHFCGYSKTRYKKAICSCRITCERRKPARERIYKSYQQHTVFRHSTAVHTSVSYCFSPQTAASVSSSAYPFCCCFLTFLWSSSASVCSLYSTPLVSLQPSFWTAAGCLLEDKRRSAKVFYKVLPTEGLMVVNKRRW